MDVWVLVTETARVGARRGGTPAARAPIGRFNREKGCQDELSGKQGRDGASPTPKRWVIHKCGWGEGRGTAGWTSAMRTHTWGLCADTEGKRGTVGGHWSSSATRHDGTSFQALRQAGKEVRLQREVKGSKSQTRWIWGPSCHPMCRSTVDTTHKKVRPHRRRQRGRKGAKSLPRKGGGGLGQRSEDGVWWGGSGRGGQTNFQLTRQLQVYSGEHTNCNFNHRSSQILTKHPHVTSWGKTSKIDWLRSHPFNR